MNMFLVWHSLFLQHFWDFFLMIYALLSQTLMSRFTHFFRKFVCDWKADSANFMGIGLPRFRSKYLTIYILEIKYIFYRSAFDQRHWHWQCHSRSTICGILDTWNMIHIYNTLVGLLIYTSDSKLWYFGGVFQGKYCDSQDPHFVFINSNCQYKYCWISWISENYQTSHPGWS